MYTAILPGRKDMVVVCHPEPAECPMCLRRIAEYLAFEIRFDFDQAVARSHQAYRAELGEDRCTEEQGQLLRLLTCQRCLPADLRGADLTQYTVEDSQATFIPSPTPTRHERAFALFVTAMLCAAALALIVAGATIQGGQ